MRPLALIGGTHFLACAAGSAVLIVLFAGDIQAWTEQDKVRADQHCATARQAAQEADQHGRRAKELGLKVEEDTRKLAEIQARIAAIENEKILKESELRSLQGQLRINVQQIKDVVQRGRVQGPGSSKAAADVAAYMRTVMASLESFANSLALCVNFPAGCTQPPIFCPSPPPVPPEVAAFLKPLLVSYHQACTSASLGVSEIVRKLREAERAVAAAKEKLQAARLEKQRMELTLAEDRRRAAEEKSAAEQDTEKARSEAAAADQAVGIQKFCEVHLKDFSAQIEKMRLEADEASRKADQLMKGTQ